MGDEQEREHSATAFECTGGARAGSGGGEAAATVACNRGWWVGSSVNLFKFRTAISISS